MIANIDELISYTQKLGDALPELRDSIVLQKPGCSAKITDNLKRVLPGIPESYVTVIKEVELNGVAIGYFHLSPSPYSGHNVAEKVISCNDSAQNPLVGTHRKHGLYQVGSWEADPICVAFENGSFLMGQIVKYNIANPVEMPVVLAEDFVTFLLLAGNLDAIRDKYSEATNTTESLNEFKQCVGHFLTTNGGNTPALWETIARIVLL
jgi:hypothetical protein